MPMVEEMAVLNAVVNNKDIHRLFEQGVEYLMTDCKDMWGFIKDYYDETAQIPTKEIMQETFPDFKFSEPPPTMHAINKLKSAYLDQELRSSLTKTAKMMQGGHSAKALESMSSDISKISRATTKVVDVDVTNIKEAVEHFKEVKDRSKNGFLGIKTNIAAFDVCLPMGISPGQLGIFLAYPSIGKSWMSLLFAVRAWKDGKVPMLISLEMTEHEVRNRIYTILGEGKFSHRMMSAGLIDIETFEKFGKEFIEGKQPFKIISNEGVGEVTPNFVKAKIDQYKPDIVFIDYLQLMIDNGKSDQETVKIKNLSRELKLMAVSQHIPIVAIASATPDDATNLESVPQLGQVAWSRQIAYDADWVLAMGRKQNSDALECAFRKNRNGYMGDFILLADFDRGRFEEVVDPTMSN
jgi:replicative DNA helicase